MRHGATIIFEDKTLSMRQQRRLCSKKRRSHFSEQSWRRIISIHVNTYIDRIFDDLSREIITICLSLTSKGNSCEFYWSS